MESKSYLFDKFLFSLRFFPFFFFFLIYLTLFLTLHVNYDLFFQYVIFFTIFQTYIVVKTALDSVRSLNVHREYEKTDFHHLYSVEKTSSSLDYDSVRIYYLLPNYKEEYDIMKKSLVTLSESVGVDVSKQVIVVLCCEERESGVSSKARRLIDVFKGVFLDIYYTLHPSGVEGEEKCKSSNLNFGCLSIESNLRKHGIDERNVLVMCSDADSLVHKKFLSAATQKFCVQTTRYNKVFGAPLDMGLNMYSIPFITRIPTYIANYTHYGWPSARNMDHFSQSTFITSYVGAKEGGFWDPSRLSDDFHFFLNLSFIKKGNFENELISLPIKGYSLNSGSWWKTCKDRFDQGNRHAWCGMDELVYFMRQTAKSVYYEKQMPMPWIRWLSILYTLIYKHLLVVVQTLTVFLIITNITISSVINKYFPDHCEWVHEVRVNFYFRVFRAIMALNGIALFTLPFYNAYYRTNGVLNDKVSFFWKLCNLKFIIIFARTLIELICCTSISTLIFVLIPIYWSSLKYMFSEKLDFIVAGKSGAAKKKKKGPAGLEGDTKLSILEETV